jgi:hypothetical protein
MVGFGARSGGLAGSYDPYRVLLGVIMERRSVNDSEETKPRSSLHFTGRVSIVVRSGPACSDPGQRESDLRNRLLGGRP